MNFINALTADLDDLRKQNLLRELREVDNPEGPAISYNGQTLVNFSSNDYLGLAGHPRIRKAALEGLEKYGAGSTASRLICGSWAPHHRLEAALAKFKGTEATLTFTSGYAAAVGAIGALAGKEDVIILDKLAHASLLDGARLSGATVRIFRHNDLEALKKLLITVSGEARRVLVITESVFSMDGDLAALREIVDLKDQYGAWLMLDEAHATGLFGENRRGLAEAYEMQERIEIQMGTLGKALGVSGGYISGRKELIDVLINKARSFIFSTAPAPAVAAAAAEAVNILSSDEGERLRRQLWFNVDRVKNLLISAGWKLGVVQSPIIPLHVGDEDKALHLARELRDAGLFLPAIRFPAVARGKARLRLTVSAAHSEGDLVRLHQVMNARHA